MPNESVSDNVGVLVIVGLVIAYATDQLPGVSTPQQVEMQTPTDECSPCEENLKRLTEAMEQAERERKAQVAASNT